MPRSAITHPLVNFEKSQRKSYACPACRKPYHQEPKLWEHGRRDHVEYLGGAEHMGKDDEVRQNFRAKALDTARQLAQTQSSGKAAISGPKKSPEYDKAAGRNMGATTQPGPLPQVVPVGHTVGDNKATDRKIDDIRDLSLDQKRSIENKDRLVSINNTRKRGAEGDPGSPEPPIVSYTVGAMSGKTHRGKTRSGGRSADFSRLASPTNDPEYTRGNTTKQPLWDPNISGPNTAKAFRRDKQHIHANTVRHSQASKEMAFFDQRRSSLGKNTDMAQSNEGFGSHHQDSLLEGKPGPLPTKPVSTTRNSEDRGSASSPEQRIPEEDRPENLELEPELLLQPETRPISHEQLVVEVKGIYAGLVMVEAKCIDIDERQSVAAQEKDVTKRFELKNDQWQSLIALHKQLLHEHHDFFLASQHPSASPALSRLAAKYSMPARMWRHGIHAFLEVLRHRLPDSLEHMLAFIYIAYSMMALLYETVPAFEDTWIECLGDLGRYRMAIEDDEPKDREVWSNVAKFWYNKASDKNPSVGRLYHHLAILARPYTLEQLSLYARSLTCVIPFESAKGSVMTLFNPVLYTNDSAQHRTSSFETVFIKIHALLFTIKLSDPTERLDVAISELAAQHLFEKYITKAGSRFKEIGVYISVANIAALFEYGFSRDGLSKSRLRLAFERVQSVKQEIANQQQQPKIATKKSHHPATLPPSTGPPEAEPGENMTDDIENPGYVIAQPARLTSIILGDCLKDPKNSSTYPLVHVYLAFIWSLLVVQQACKSFERDVVVKTIEKEIPWTRLCMFLNILAVEPYTLTAKIYAQWYYPINWFNAALMDDDERSLDLPSMIQLRVERILWLAHRIASVQRWIIYNKMGARFEVADHINDILSMSIQQQDTTMSESETLDYSPRTSSLADASIDSTRASSPTSTIAPTETPPLDDQEPAAGGEDVIMTDPSSWKNKTSNLPEPIERPYRQPSGSNGKVDVMMP